MNTVKTAPVMTIIAPAIIKNVKCSGEIYETLNPPGIEMIAFTGNTEIL